jgi:hypothetical protein
MIELGVRRTAYGERQGKEVSKLREDIGKRKGKQREERVGKARPVLLSHFAFPLPFPPFFLSLLLRSDLVLTVRRLPYAVRRVCAGA